MFERRASGPSHCPNVWFSKPSVDASPLRAEPQAIEPIQLDSEEAVGKAMLVELERVAAAKSETDGPDAPVAIALLGGRGAQAMHRLLGQRHKDNPEDPLIRRLVVFTQDALAPLPMASPLSFVRDFERLLGVQFFKDVRRFVPFETESLEPEQSTLRSLQALDEVGGLDIFFIGHGPEAEAASHLAYIKPGSGAQASDWGGAIPISASILEHHISKFRAGGSAVSPGAEAECRRARNILTLGPAAILGAKCVIQSVVDAATAPAKKQSYRRVMDTELSTNMADRQVQLDANPGLWLRLHSNVKSFVLPDLLR